MSAASSPNPPAAPARGGFWLGVLLVAAVVAAYHNALPGEFLFDDTESVRDNPTIRSLATAWVPPADSGQTVAGRPLLNFSFALNRVLLGAAPAGFHAVNLGIHVVATLLVFLLTRAALRGPVLRARWGDDASGLAAGVALVWGVHPLGTESVTYIVQRAESLAAAWVLLALFAFARGAERPAGEAAEVSRRRRRLWWTLSFVATLLGVATKEVVAVVPVLAWLYDAAFLAGDVRAAWRARWKTYALLAVAWLPLAFFVAHAGQRGGTAGLGTAIDSWTYLVTQSRAVWLYLKLAFWPAPLVIDHGLPTYALAEVWPFAAATVVLLASTVWALRCRPAVGFLGAWFFVLLAPSSSFVPVATQTIAEHRMYLPLAAVVAGVLVLLWSRIGRVTWVVIVLAALAGGLTTWQRNLDYRSEEAMWRLATAQNPENPRPPAALGAVLLNSGRPNEAIPWLTKAAEMAPRDARYRLALARGLANARRWEAAWSEFDAAVRLAPALCEAHVSYGNALAEVGRHADAVAHFERALALKPDLVAVRFNLANALYWSGRVVESLPHYEAALAREPAALDVRTNYAGALVAAGNLDRAFAEATAVLHQDAKLAPAHFVVAQVWFARSDYDVARKELEETLRLDARHRDAHYALGQLELATEHPSEAEKHFAEFLKLEPNAAAGHNARGIALAQLGRLSEARDAFSRAVALAPDFTDARENLRRALSELSGR